jgi:hypothetical protein
VFGTEKPTELEFVFSENLGALGEIIGEKDNFEDLLV